ncbi:hypothetical protein [Streptococcus sp. 20-1249]|uniref:hypothetical protein n=1 Tax=Streptococcus hepaticus TaxID=3349163 RepID=UPI0037479189
MMKSRRGGTLSMVIITLVVVSAMTMLMAQILSVSSTQTTQMYYYMDAKYIATSGSQLAMGAYFEGNGTTSDLYTEFSKRATGKTAMTEPVIAHHQFEHGKADIRLTGEFKGSDHSSENYYVTVESKAKMVGSENYYVHRVTFNWSNPGLRSETGGIEPVSK